jgi:hypothetical protein
MLKNHRHFLTQGFDFAAARFGDVFTLEPDFAGSRLDQPVNAPEQGGFAGAREADDDKKFALVNVKRNVVKGAHAAGIDFREMADSK